MKKVLAFLVVMALLILCLYAYATAEVDAEEEYEVIYTVQTLTYDGTYPIKAGSTFDLHVSINAVPSISMVELHLRYNKQLMLPVSSTTGGFLNRMENKDCNLAPLTGEDPIQNAYGEIWITGMTVERFSTGQGEIFATITFRAQKDIVSSSPIYCAGTPQAAAVDNEVRKLKTDCVDGGVYFSSAYVPPLSGTSSVGDSANSDSGNNSVLPNANTPGGDTGTDTTTQGGPRPPTVSRATTAGTGVSPDMTTTQTMNVPTAVIGNGTVVTLVPAVTHETMETTLPSEWTGRVRRIHASGNDYGWIVVLALVAILCVIGMTVLPRKKDRVKAWIRFILVKMRPVTTRVQAVLKIGAKRKDDEEAVTDETAPEEDGEQTTEVVCLDAEEEQADEDDNTANEDGEDVDPLTADASPLVNEEPLDEEPFAEESCEPIAKEEPVDDEVTPDTDERTLTDEQFEEVPVQETATETES